MASETVFSGIKVTILNRTVITKDQFHNLSKKTFEIMLKNKLDVFISVDTTKHSILQRHMEHWCYENCISLVYINGKSHYFEDPEEATGFKLRWAQES